MKCCCSKGAYDIAKEEKRVEKNFTWFQWKRPLVAIVLTFLCNVESSMLAVGEWPYMQTIDHDSTSSFFGVTTAVNKAGHAIFAFGFAIWAHKISGIRIPMLVGRLITLIACVMYIFAEFLPSNKRWWMMACYVLFGIGFGTSPLLRSYIARVTSDENRSTACALQNGASVLSVVVGPLAQISFIGLPYPGVAIISPHINLSIYTAPIWLSLITNIIAIALILVGLDDTREETEEKEEESSIISLSSIRDRLIRLRSLNLPWILILLVILEKVVSGLALSTTTALSAPVMTVMYALTGQNAILALAVSQMIVGCVAIGLALVFLLCKLGRLVSCRVLFVFSNIAVIIGYIITFPYPFMSNPMQPFNETTRAGCNPQEYSWCNTQLAVHLIPFLIIMIITNSFAIPSAALSLDTIYSKMIGNIDQNLMQSLIVIGDDVIQIVAPIYGSALFTSSGINPINIINGSIYIVATIVWIGAWKWLTPFN